MADDFRVQAQLITAIFELSAVKSIRGAMRVNLLRRGGREGPLGNIENPKPPLSQANFGEQRHGLVPLHPPTSLDAPPPRVREVGSIDRCDRRCADRATDAIVSLPNMIPTDATLPASDAERASGLPARHDSPLAPPWSQPLPIVPQPIVHVVKYEAVRPDHQMGRLLDCFL